MDGLFPVDAWKKIFGRIPPYPMSLPDDLVRQIADLAIHVRNMSEQIEAAIENEDHLQAYMAAGLVSGSLKRITGHIAELLQEKAQGKEEQAPDLTPDARSMRQWDTTT